MRTPVLEDGKGRSLCVGVLAPTGRDASLATEMFRKFRIDAVAHTSMSSMVEAIRHGTIATAVVAEEALHTNDRIALIEELDRQPSWSDLPLVLLTSEGELSRALGGAIESLAERANVTLLERPIRVATLITVLRSALRARTRQYDVRDHLVELNSARAEAEAANRAKVEFLAMMSHELRTPLNAIAGYAEILELGIPGAVNDSQREQLGRIKRSQRHLLGLINGVLNFARIERGAVEYRVAPVPVGDLFSSVELFVAPQAKGRGLVLEFSSCDDTMRALGDAEKIQQILLNLIGNAIKFTEPGGRVAVECRRSRRGVEILVSDTGSGIPTDRLDAIFEPFVQVDSGLTRSQDGVGLGLAISRDLARGMGGDLSAESTIGVGSRFLLTLKAAD